MKTPALVLVPGLLCDERLWRHQVEGLAHLARDPRTGPGDKMRILAVALAATAGGTAATLWALHALLAPVTASSEALRRYLERGEVPDLPTSYPDRAGRLMSDVQSSVERLDAALRSLGQLAAKDHLTGVLNRRAGEERLAQDVARARRGGGRVLLPEAPTADLRGRPFHPHRSRSISPAAPARDLAADMAPYLFSRFAGGRTPALARVVSHRTAGGLCMGLARRPRGA